MSRSRARGSGHGEACTLPLVTILDRPDDEIDNGPSAGLSAIRTKSSAHRASGQASATESMHGSGIFALSLELAGAHLRGLEGRSVEQPDRKSADRNDAKKDEREGD